MSPNHVASPLCARAEHWGTRTVVQDSKANLEDKWGHWEFMLSSFLKAMLIENRKIWL